VPLFLIQTTATKKARTETADETRTTG